MNRFWSACPYVQAKADTRQPLTTEHAVPQTNPRLVPWLVLFSFAVLTAGCADDGLIRQPTAAEEAVLIFQPAEANIQPVIQKSFRKIRASTCRYQTNPDGAKSELRRNLRRQAVDLGANGIASLTYRPVLSGRGSCRSGLVAIGTPVVFGH
jgi:hypothetical protein